MSLQAYFRKETSVSIAINTVLSLLFFLAQMAARWISAFTN